MRQGQHRDGTPRKEIGFRMVLRQNLRMTLSPGLRQRIYWHIDLSSGCGWNHDADCPGSPMVFLEVAREVGRSFNAVFCDHNEQAMTELRELLRSAIAETGSSTVTGVCRDNADALRAFSEMIREQEEHPSGAIGSWLCDPNGTPGTLLLERLKVFCQQFPRIDAILNLNVSLFARVRGCKGNPNTPGFDDWPDPRDVLGLRPFKSHWLVRNPPSIRGERFIMFLGRNTPNGMTRFEEFYPIDSDQGQAILKGLVRVNPVQPFRWEGT